MSGFLGRLFGRKPKAASCPGNLPFRRSQTDPQQPAGAPAYTSSSDRSDTDTFDPSVPAVPRRNRRGGFDIMRSKTSVDIQPGRRSSVSSGSDAVVEDPIKSIYRQLRPVHRSRLHTIMSGQDRNSKKTVVLKAYQKSRLSSTVRAKMESEKLVLQQLYGAPGVVRLLNYVEDDECCYLVMERCPGHTLIEVVANSGGRIQERALVIDVLIPLLECLAALHKRGIVHRQLKPEHVMVSASGVHLLDFSEALYKSQRGLNCRAGPLEYMAPEVLCKPTAEEIFHQVLYHGMSEDELCQYDEKADIWSLGALIYEALTGCQPFLADTVEDMQAAQRCMVLDSDDGGSPRVLSGRSLSVEAAHFLRQALQYDPAQRPSAEQLLQHPFVTCYMAQYQAKQQHLYNMTAGLTREEGRMGRATVPGVPLPQPAAPCVATVAAAAVNSRGTILLATPIQFAVR